MRRPTPFGKYYLLDRVNVGGMAEVFRAKATGVEGFEKLVAIKRILPNIAEDDEFITMFIDEAKISVQLSHANIAQIYDLGRIDESYFIAMEFIAGKDLRTMFERSRKRGEILPISMSCYMVARVCEGLDYAHRKKDPQGRDLHIVHRDVSPQNVLVSYEGEVKLIDFGIAKAANKASKTQAGILKGKFGYMSPEQVRGLPIDRRSDVFSVGIVLYELLTSERLFVGESDFSTLEKVRNVEIMPPTTYNKRIPDELETIVLKALARDPDERYRSAGELQEELSRFLASTGNIFSRRDLAQFMKTSFADDIAREEHALHQFREGAGEAPATPPVAGRVAEPVQTPPTDDDNKTRVYDGAPTFMDEYMASDGPPPLPSSAPRNLPPTPPPAPAPPRGAPSSAPRGPTHAAGTTARPDAAPALLAAPPRTAAASTPAHAAATLASVSLETHIGPAPVYRPPAAPQATRRSRALVAVAGVALLAGAGVLFVYLRGLDTSRPAPFEVTTSPRAAAKLCPPKGDGECRELGTAGDDGKLTGVATAGRHSLVLERAGCETRTLPIVLAAKGPNALAPATLSCAAATGLGNLVIQSTPPGATVRFLRADLAAWNGTTPYARKDLPPGDYPVELRLEGHLPKALTAAVKPGAEARLDATLAARTVRLRVETAPAGARVRIVARSTKKVVARAAETPATLVVDRGTDEGAVYTAELEKKGHTPASVEIRFDGRAEQPLSAAPVPLPATEARAEPVAAPEPEAPAPAAKKPAAGKAPADDGDADESPRAPATAPAPAKPAETLGTLDVNLRGAWAYVHIDGRNTGKPTPLVGHKLKPGKYRITLVRDELGLFQEFLVVIQPNKLTRALRHYKPRE